MKQRHFLKKAGIFFSMVAAFGMVNPISNVKAEESDMVYVEKLGFGVAQQNDLKAEAPANGDGKNTPYFSASNNELRIETYSNEISPNVVKDITDLKDATPEQIKAVTDARTAYIGNQGITITKDPTVEEKEFNGSKYLVFYYEGNGYGNDMIDRDYVTVKDGQDITFQCYALANKTEEQIQALLDQAENLMTNVVFGSKEEAGKAISEMKKSAPDDSTQEKEKETIFTKMNKTDIPTWIFFVVIGLIAVFGVKIKKPGQWHDDFMSLDSSKAILGICSVLIVLHHVSQGLAAQAGALHCLENIGVGFVGIFFLFSGYGLFKSKMNKENYLKGFLKKRMPTILIPFYVMTLIFFGYSLIMGAKYEGKELFYSLTGWTLLNSHAWYIVEIALFYLVFFLLFRFIKKDGIALAIMTVFVAGVTVGSLLLGHGEYWFQGEWWFNTSLVFVLGMLFAKFEKPLVAFLKKFYYLVLAIAVVLEVVLYKATMHALETYSYWSETDFLPAYGDKFRCLSVQLPMVIVFVLIVLLVSMKIKFKNKVMDFLGKISLEIYLIHNLFIGMIQVDGIIPLQSPFFFALFVVVAAIASAAIIHFVDQLLLKPFKRK